MTDRLRLATEADAAAVQAIYAPYVEKTAISFETEPPSVAETAARIARTGITYPWLVYETDAGGVLGYAYASQHRDRAAYRWSVDVAVYVDAAAQRRGAGRALYGRLLPLLARLGYHNAYAGITLPNAASIGLHAAMGFRPVGVYRNVGHKLGAWHDVGWWVCVLRDAAAEPAEPLPLSRLGESEYEGSGLDPGAAPQGRPAP